MAAHKKGQLRNNCFLILRRSLKTLAPNQGKKGAVVTATFAWGCSLYSYFKTNSKNDATFALLVYTTSSQATFSFSYARLVIDQRGFSCASFALALQALLLLPLLLALSLLPFSPLVLAFSLLLLLAKGSGQ